MAWTPTRRATARSPASGCTNWCAARRGRPHLHHPIPGPWRAGLRLYLRLKPWHGGRHDHGIGDPVLCLVWAGIQNALAGGGTFLMLPALMFTGMTALSANITSTVALFPGQLTSSWGGRGHVSGAGGLSFRALVSSSPGGRYPGRHPAAGDPVQHLQGAGALAGAVRHQRLCLWQLRAAQGGPPACAGPGGRRRGAVRLSRSMAAISAAASVF